MFAKPKGLFSSRWWRAAGLIFSACCFLGFWATFFVAILGALVSPMSNATFVAAGLILTLVLPAAVAVVLGTVIEAGMPQEEPLPLARRTRRLLQIVGSFLLGPFAIVACLVAARLQTRGMNADFEARNNRPIVSGDHVGFCDPPTYRVRDGLPVVDLTIRLPRSGFYMIVANGSDAALGSCEGQVDTVLQAGVHVLPITLGHRGAEPLVPERIAWPVTVRQLLVRNVATEQDPDGDGWYDSRSSLRGIATIGPPP